MTTEKPLSEKLEELFCFFRNFTAKNVKELKPKILNDFIYTIKEYNKDAVRKVKKEKILLNEKMNGIEGEFVDIKILDKHFGSELAGVNHSQETKLDEIHRKTDLQPLNSEFDKLNKTPDTRKGLCKCGHTKESHSWNNVYKELTCLIYLCPCEKFEELAGGKE